MNASISHLSPPWPASGKRLESLLRKAIQEFQLITEEDQNIAIALSGGKDSLSLLLLLKAISGHGVPPFNLHAIHVSGAYSCGASISTPYIQKICSLLEVPLIIRDSSLEKDKLECYSCSRERRKLLFSAAKEAGCQKIAFGHHRDDNIQTLLLNLLHKAEFAANLPLVPMQHYGVTIIRPLIYAPEEDIRSFAQQSGFLRITCQCPIGQNSMRKKVDQLIEHMEQYFPHVRSNLSQAAHNYGSDKALRP